MSRPAAFPSLLFRALDILVTAFLLVRFHLLLLIHAVVQLPGAFRLRIASIEASAAAAVLVKLP